MASPRSLSSFTARISALLPVWSLLTTIATAQVRPAYAVFDGQGKKLSHEKFLRTVAAGDIILFGPLHTLGPDHYTGSVASRWQG